MTTEAPLNSSPTKSLSTWWKSFKSEDAGARPGLSRSSASVSHVPQVHHSKATTPAPPGASSNLGVPQMGNMPAPSVGLPFGDVDESPIFGAPLKVSLSYASVKISLTDNYGESFVYGRVPVVIAKCAVYLKQNARGTEGIFRIPGSARRIRVLQDLFSATPEFGRQLSWDGFTVHDAANLLKRYLSMLPDPVIPRSRYAEFRKPLMQENKGELSMPTAPALITPVTPTNSTPNPTMTPTTTAPVNAPVTSNEPENMADKLDTFEDLIFALPRSSRQLLLYLIDLLSVFAAQSEQNRMPAANLASIFQPSVLTIAEHDMKPEEAQISRSVLQFLIENAVQLLKRMQIRAVKQHELQKHSSDKLETDDGASDDEDPMPIPQLQFPAGATHRRQHSKSVSSAAALKLDEPTKFPFLRRQRSSRSNSQSEEDTDEDRKSRFRRSLMILLPQSSSRSTSPSRTK